MKRIFLLIATNLAIMVMLSLIISVFGLNQWLTAKGINHTSLLVFCAVFGFGGAFLSLAMSKIVAKWSVGAKIIDGTEGATEVWLVNTVRRFADKAGIAMPQVAIYEGAPNAFATGPSKNNSLVAVSTGLLQTMNRQQVEAVIAHEIAHIQNSDMVTLTLIQGVVNTFVMFAARIVGYAIDKALSSNDEESESQAGTGIGFMITVFVLDIIFGILASAIVAWFSRQREFRADAGAAALLGSSQPMIDALRALDPSAQLPKQVAAFGISGGIGSVFASHPAIEQRIEALSKLN